MADLNSLYAAESLESLRHSYDTWAEAYDADVQVLGRMTPPVVTGFTARCVPAGVNGPVLDVGCGTGAMGRILTSIGFGPVDGLDLSPGMLAAAERKGIYRQLFEAALGPDRLAMRAGSYAVVTATGVFTPGHAGPDGLPELIRVTRSGGVIVFGVTLPALDDTFHAAIQALCDRGAWQLAAASDPFPAMLGRADAPQARVFVYRVT